MQKKIGRCADIWTFSSERYGIGTFCFCYFMVPRYRVKLKRDSFDEVVTSKPRIGK